LGVPKVPCHIDIALPNPNSALSTSCTSQRYGWLALVTKLHGSNRIPIHPLFTLFSTNNPVAWDKDDNEDASNAYHCRGEEEHNVVTMEALVRLIDDSIGEVTVSPAADVQVSAFRSFAKRILPSSSNVAASFFPLLSVPIREILVSLLPFPSVAMLRILQAAQPGECLEGEKIDFECSNHTLP
jgi:hypothetical protein